MGIFNFFRKQPVTKSAIGTEALISETKEYRDKTYIPYFIYKPPFGYPRNLNVSTLRALARSPYPHMAISTIIEEVTAINWDIVPKDETKGANQSHIEHVKALFRNPNNNSESFRDILAKIIRDMLVLNSGVIVKLFDANRRLAGFEARDGATFTMNPDIHGSFSTRADFVDYTEVYFPEEPQQEKNRLIMLPEQARQQAAYFQYGWTLATRPIPLGKKELIWFQHTPSTDSIYGFSPIQVLYNTLQILIYGEEYYLDYFINNNVPKGVLGLSGVDSDTIKSFKKQWEEMITKKDEIGNKRMLFHTVPVINTDVKFEKIQFSAAELSLINMQQWFSKMVWAVFGVTPSELGYTESSNRATEIVQSRVFRRKAINPIVRKLEYKINQELVSEFGYDDVQFKFLTEDIDEELHKTELYEKQITLGLRTINEIRAKEGLEPLEWGDQPPSKWQKPTNISYFQPITQQQPSEEAQQPQSRSKNTKSSPQNSLNTPAIEVKADLDSEIKKILTQTQQQLLKELDNLAPKKIAKKSADDILQKLQSMLPSIADIVKPVLEKSINENYHKGLISAEKEADMNFFANQKVLQFLNDYTFENVKGINDDLANKLRQVIQRGILENKSITQLKEEVQKVFNTTKQRAEMIARTETVRAENYGKLNGYQQIGKGVKKYLEVTMDNRTSEICKAMRRKYGTPDKAIPIDENFKVTVNGKEISQIAPPFHVDCRTTVQYILPETTTPS